MVETKQPPASCSWGDFMDEVSPELPPLFPILADEREEEEDDDEAIARLLEEDGEDDEDDAILPSTPSRPESALSEGSPASAQVELDLLEMCRRAAAKLSIDWPSQQTGQGTERDLYDGKRLPSRAPATKQVIPAVPACVSEMKRFWDKPFSHRVPVKGFSRLDVQNMEELGMSNPPPVELSVAHHLNPNRKAAFSSASASLPGRTERLTASVFQKIYRSSALAVRALNATSLLTAYQAELMEEMGRQMDAGSPNPALWEEICVIADLNLRTSRGAVQSCGRSMGLAVVGSWPRAQQGLKIKTHKKSKLLNPELQSPAPPLDGVAAPLVGKGCSGPLVLHAESWRACAVHPWVLSTIIRGYRLQFAVKPPVFNSVLMSTAEGNSAQVLEEEIASLLKKRAVRIVPPEDSHQGFYSRYFLIPKRGGGLRPILDLRILNKHLRKYNFKMPTFKTLSHFIHEKDWFTSVDLEDAYFHIDIYPAHRKFLRFAYQGTAYEFTTVPFGLSLAPRTFCKCIEAALSPLRTAGLRVSAYLDDLLLCSPSRQQAETDTKMLVSHLTILGFKINETKSCLMPTQEIVYLGLRLNSDQYQAFLSEERIRSIRSCLSLFQEGSKVPFRLCLRLLGLMASTVSVIPLGLLRMREFQNWTAAQHLCPKRHLNRKVTVSALCVRAVRYWRNRSFLESGTPLGVVSMRKVVTTDASLSGWGAVCEGRIAKGKWPASLKCAHINYLELLTVFLALKHFVQFLWNHHVLIRSDNTTAVAYINRQGGTRSPRLHSLAQKLIVWGRKHFHSLRATHVPGIMNTGADLLSRGNPRYGEWTLHPQVVGQLWKRFGRAAVDLFASHENNRCPLFFSLARDGAPMGVDALAYPWPNVLLYAFPPLSLIIPTLRRVKQYGHSVILIAPNWPGKLWLTEITQLLVDQPWPLPLRRDLLSQARGEIFHPAPDKVALWAWPVKG
ncbi:uncharacterized protein [Garra rufa]|uniref:uncharacterized protein n=1 Tax=Garra rufa TaxID=137080 RepID=UPI003CCE94F0